MTAPAYPRGSEWRKWDLHIHAPGTRLADGYGKQPDWDRYCRVLEESDVAAFGITDYFTLESFFECKKQFASRYPHTSKVLFPNLELRLNETVNKNQDQIDIHVLFRPDVSVATVDKFLRKLDTELPNPKTGTKLACSELEGDENFESATVTRDSLKRALVDTFGPDPERDEYLIVVPANNSGLRAQSGKKRKEALADMTDRLAAALFGNAGNSDHFLRRDRYEDKSVSVPKPVFCGCDAHSFDDLERSLGKAVNTESHKSTPTWIKADPTFDGLLQTLAEPAERVRIQADQPDKKQPYQVISAVRFSGTSDFPPEIIFNQNLVAVIGSRSSGKSALLAHIAHAVDPEYTEHQQLAVGPPADASNIGPAAAKTWAEVADVGCEIEWLEPDVKTGKVIYIPQNSLFAISDRADDITDMIEPALGQMDPEFATALQRMEKAVAAENTRIGDAVEEWFRVDEELGEALETLRDLGDKKAIEKTRGQLDKKIEILRKKSVLSPAVTKKYEKLIERLTEIGERVAAVEDESGALAPYFAASPTGKKELDDEVGATVYTHPATDELPEMLALKIDEFVETSEKELSKAIRKEVARYQAALDGETVKLADEEKKLRTDNLSLITKAEADAEIGTLMGDRKKQEDALKRIGSAEKRVKRLRVNLKQEVEHVVDAIRARLRAIENLEAVFASQTRELDNVTFGLERDLDPQMVDQLSIRFNRRDAGAFLDKGTVDINACQSAPGDFLPKIGTDAQKIKRDEDAERVAIDVLQATPEVRFVAEMDDDRIGGFVASSMTPGKQALFALTLILNQTTEAWPLLIDQPEDDLDSRSVYDVLVSYLVDRKKERQIIMVSHNANLVVGSDAEQVIVANRHGDDRPNRGKQLFDYMSGSLEHTRERKDSKFVFDEGGIREHTCDLLDGGEEAFKKRKQKYKI